MINNGYGSIQYSEAPAKERQALLSHQVPSNRRWAYGRNALFVGVLAAIFLLVVSRDSFGALEASASGKSSGSYKKNFLLDEDYDTRELFFDQTLDHMTDSKRKMKQKYSQRYYKKSKHWKGPGHPIFIVMGGEDSLDLPMLYPYVNKGLAKEFGAFVVSPEHRFYGKSQPVKHAENKELVKYLTPDQALLDAISLVQMVREKIGCSKDRTSKDYCPVISFGGSYPGFLAAMLRFRFPDIIDAAYASSAPLDLYAQNVDPNAYFDKVTEVAEMASPGCANGVRSTMFAVRDELLTDYTSIQQAAKAVGFCHKTFPDYIQDIPEFISETITYLVPAVFADFNMEYYPPGPHTALERACAIFKDDALTPMERMSAFYDLRGVVEYGMDKAPECFDLSLELPSGPNARIRGSDNSGTGGGFTGEIWEFQCCKDVVAAVGYSEQSMFIPRPFSYEWLENHCSKRFPGVPFEPRRMVNQWGFNDLSKTSRILFSNGLNDGWSTSSILKTDNIKLEVINLPNGAHHSDFATEYPLKNATHDIIEGHEDAKAILGHWLDQIKKAQV